MIRTRFFLVLALFASCLVLPNAAKADSITLLLTNAEQSGSPGDTLTFAATVSVPSGSDTVFFYSASLNSFSPLLLNADSFFNNFPISLDSGGIFTGDLFTVTLPVDLLAGTYGGTVTLQSGSAGSYTYTTANFYVNAVAVTPEPSGLVLLATGLSILVVAVGLKRLSPSSRTQ